MGGRITRVVLAAPSEAKPKWFDKVDGKVLSALSEKEKKRQEVIFELIQTEKDFVRDLDIIINVRSFFSFFMIILNIPTFPPGLLGPNEKEEIGECQGYCHYLFEC